jgi:hypothetical protein
MTDARRFAPATERNRGPILDVLRTWLPGAGTVLEIASGTGEHVVHFAAALPQLAFQPSDPDPANRDSIAAWITQAGVTNARSPLDLDATTSPWTLPEAPVAILCINMIHISPWAATLGLMRNAGSVLATGEILYLYGAFKRAGAHTAPSNAAFDDSLHARNPAWGVRDLEAVLEAGASTGLTLAGIVPMPANNFSVVLRRT